jgi:hypothetical protein
MKTTIDPQLIKACADKGAEAANTHPSLQGTTYLTVRDEEHDFLIEQPAREAFAQAAIEHYLANAPKAESMWVSSAERSPRLEDAGKDGVVATWSEKNGFSVRAIDGNWTAEYRCLWLSTKSVPTKLVDPLRESFDKWCSTFEPKGDKEELFAAWGASRKAAPIVLTPVTR